MVARKTSWYGTKVKYNDVLAACARCWRALLHHSSLPVLPSFYVRGNFDQLIAYEYLLRPAPAWPVPLRRSRLPGHQSPPGLIDSRIPTSPPFPGWQRVLHQLLHFLCFHCCTYVHRNFESRRWLMDLWCVRFRRDRSLSGVADCRVDRDLQRYKLCRAQLPEASTASVRFLGSDFTTVSWMVTGSTPTFTFSVHPFAVAFPRLLRPLRR